MEQKYAQAPLSIADDELLDKDEIIVIVDDYADIVSLLQDFLQQQGFSSTTAASAEDLRRHLSTGKVALVLLDIGLPDANGTELIPELKENFSDLAIIMLTAVTDLQTALACLRFGADDYLTKPVHFTDLLTTLRKALEKRRLKIKNRHYQRQIEEARFRIQFNHELAMKMNTAYLSTVELDEILHAVLVGITAEEGLQFNRAFLALFDASGQTLEGRLAIGPGNREDGGRIWQDIRSRELRLHDLLESIHSKGTDIDTEVNRIVRALKVHVLDADHILLRAVRERISIHVINGQCSSPVPVELLGLLREDNFVVVPLYSPSRSLGVIIADHFVTREPITSEQINALESFAGQASLAIEHCRLYMAMQRKIKELEAVTSELEKNKDLLIEAERYSTVGHMAAQLAHSIRNPITAIGGTARLLARKTENQDSLPFFDLMISESEKIEKTLEDLFTFVDQVKPVLEKTHLLPLVRRSLLLHFNSLQEKEIEQEVVLPEVDPLINVDPRLIQQALVHLIRNSVEAMPGGGMLTVEVLLEESRVKIIISDSGEGLGNIHPARATDPFFTTKMIGTGMGLTLVKRIVEDHNGTLRLESRKEGHGTIATVVLPRVR